MLVVHGLFTQCYHNTSLIKALVSYLKPGLSTPSSETIMTDSSPQTEDQYLHLARITSAGANAAAKRVVIGVDGSELSNYACDWFFEHLWSSDDYVVLLNCPDQHDIVKSQWSGGSSREPGQKLREGERHVYSELGKFKEKLLQRGANGEVKTMTAKSPGDAILKTAEEEEACLIVIGCRGRGTIRRTILGSVSDYIVHHSTVPVVVCRLKTSRRKSSATISVNPSDLNTSGR